jgi:hypothetical protein
MERQWFFVFLNLVKIYERLPLAHPSLGPNVADSDSLAHNSPQFDPPVKLK